MNKLMTLVITTGAVLAGATHRNQIKTLQKKIDELREERITYHMNGFESGWEQAKQEYTRWYSRDQHQLVFGEDRGY